MDYRQAKTIREKSFGTLLAEQEGGFGSSLKAALSQKSKARAAGLKEKFDPLNIAKTLTGGSNWAPAMLGKLFNVDKKRVDYFSGVKPKSTANLQSSESLNSPEAVECLGYIYKSLKQSAEDKRLADEQKRSLLEEEEAEEESRNQEIVKALTARFGKKMGEKEKPYRDEKGRFAKKPTEQKPSVTKETPKNIGGKTQTKPIETPKVETPSVFKPNPARAPTTPTTKTPIIPSGVSKGVGIGAAAVAGAMTITKIIEVGKGYNVVQLASGETVKREGVWNWRNNNPGNIEYGDYALANGAIPFGHGKNKPETPEERFAIFPTYEIGRKAKENLIFEQKKSAHKLGPYSELTIDKAIEKYAPPFANGKKENETDRYQNKVKSALKKQGLTDDVLATRKMKDYTPEQRTIILTAMEEMEGYGVGKKSSTVLQKGPNSTSSDNNIGNKIDSSSKDNKNLKADVVASNDKSASVISSTNVNSQQHQNPQSSPQGDDTNAYQKKAKGK
jgi:hypothetical protein